MTKKTIYMPTSDSNVELQVGKVDNRDYYKYFEKVKDVYEEELYTFTEEELNKYTESVIRKALDIAAEKAEPNILNKRAKNPNFTLVNIDKESITDSFEEVYQNFKV